MTAKVFIVDREYKADHRVFFVEREYEQKNHKIISPGKLVAREYEADIKVAIVDREYQSTIKILRKNFPK